MFRRQTTPKVQSTPTVPSYGDMKERVPSLCHVPPSTDAEWYPPVMVGAGALAEIITGRRYIGFAGSPPTTTAAT